MLQIGGDLMGRKASDNQMNISIIWLQTLHIFYKNAHPELENQTSRSNKGTLNV